MSDAIQDGVHRALDRHIYDRLGRVNISLLKWIEKSPAHYRHFLINPAADTDPMRLGRVSHMAVFEPERFRASIAVWDGPRRAGKDWESFCQRNAGLELLTEEQHARCLAIQRAVRADPYAAPYLKNGAGEVTLLWSSGTTKCKGRIDFDAETALVDLKTTRDGSEEGFARQSWNLRYHTRAAWYQDSYFILTGVRKPYVIVTTESTEPFFVTVYRVPDRLLDIGREQYAGWLDKLDYCTKHSVWPAYAEGILELQMPPWAVPDEDDPTGLGLQIGSAR